MSARTAFLVATVAAASFTACNGCDDPVASNADPSLRDATQPDADAGFAWPDALADTDENDLGGDIGGDMAVCTTLTCGTDCCAAGDECVEGVCRPPCGGTRCGATSELCCEGADVCIFDACTTPGAPCSSSFQCPDGAYCEPILGACIDRDLINVDCEFRPPIGVFTPSPESQFGGVDIGGVLYDHSMASPIVVDIDVDGVPEVVAQMYRDSLAEAVLVVLDGRDLSLRAWGALGELQPNAAGIAAANLDPTTPELEVVGQAAGGGLVAYRIDMAAGTITQMWLNNSGNLAGISNESAPSIADLDADGSPEIILGFSVLDAAGNLWNGLDGGPAGGQAANSAITTAVDLDQDGMLDVVAGNRVMRTDGSMLWDRSVEYSDGFPAVADLDGDGSAEVVSVSAGQVIVFSTDGQTVVFGPVALPGGGQGGPPTIADFDGDGRREIAAAGQGRYTVFDPDCTGAAPDPTTCPTGGDGDGILWSVDVQDLSSSRTGSSVFDFEGDGKAEVVYNDECFLRVFDGTNGTVLFETANTTRTGSEAPIVADVDGDFNAEIVVVSNNDQIARDMCETNYPNYPAGGTTGVFVYGDANDNWVTTRPVWNQHAYHITHILEDGTVTSPEPVHYQREVTNSFRLNVQPDGLFNAPDLVVESVEIRNPSCGEDVTVEIAVTVTNEGSLGVGAGTEVEVTATDGNTTQNVGVVTTTRPLLPSQSETILITWTLPAGWENSDVTVNGVVDPSASINECIEDNNTGSGETSAGNRSYDDLLISALTVDDATCGTNAMLAVEVTITNQGQGGVQSGLPIVVEALRGATSTLIAEVATTGGLGRNQSESFVVPWDVPVTLVGQQFEVRATIDPNGVVTACSNDNQTVPADCLPPQ